MVKVLVSQCWIVSAVTWWPLAEGYAGQELELLMMKQTRYLQGRTRLPHFCLQHLITLSHA
jgi:hypothetical protein